MVASRNQYIKQEAYFNRDRGKLSKYHFSIDFFSFNKSVALRLQRYIRHTNYLKPRLLCSEILIVQTFRLTSMIDMIQRFLSL